MQWYEDTCIQNLGHSMASVRGLRCGIMMRLLVWGGTGSRGLVAGKGLPRIVGDSSARHGQCDMNMCHALNQEFVQEVIEKNSSLLNRKNMIVCMF